MAARTVRALQDEPLDALLYRLDTLSAGRVESVLDANRGLAARGPWLPESLPVLLPDPPPALSAVGTIHLWD